MRLRLDPAIAERRRIHLDHCPPRSKKAQHFCQALFLWLGDDASIWTGSARHGGCNERWFQQIVGTALEMLVTAACFNADLFVMYPLSALSGISHWPSYVELGGFTAPARYRMTGWWAHQDSNLEPRDSHDPTVSSRCGLSLHPQRNAGRVRDALACDQGHSSPQVVSAPSDGVPPAWLRVAIGCAGEVPLNSSRSRTSVTGRRHHLDESPALTIEL